MRRRRGPGSLLAGVGFFGADQSQLTRTLKVFDTGTGKEVASVAFPGVFARADEVGPGGLYLGFVEPIFCPDKPLLAVPHGTQAGRGRDQTRRRVEWYFVEPRTGKVVRTLEDPFTSVFGRRVSVRQQACFFTGDGKQFVCSTGNVVHTFDVTTGLPVHTLRGHVNAIAAAASTADGQLLRTVEIDGTLKEWNLRPVGPARVGVMERSSRDFGRAPDTIRVSADATRVAGLVPARDGKPDTVLVWDVAAKKPTALKARPRDESLLPSYLLHLSADGNRVLLVRSGRRRGFEERKPNAEKPAPRPDLTVWDVASQTELFHFEFAADDRLGDPGLTEFTPDGSAVAMVPGGPNPDDTAFPALRMFDVNARREARPIEISGSVLRARFSPDGKRLAGMVRKRVGQRLSTQAVVWDVARGTEVLTADIDSFAAGDGSRVAGQVLLDSFWSPDGTKLAVTTTVSTQVYLLDVATGKLLRSLNVSSRGGWIDSESAIVFSPDGRRIACDIRMNFGSSVVTLLDTNSGKELLSLPTTAAGFSRTSAPLAFSADGRLLRRFDVEPPPGRFDLGNVQAPMVSTVRVTTWDATPRTESGP